MRGGYSKIKCGITNICTGNILLKTLLKKYTITCRLLCNFFQKLFPGEKVKGPMHMTRMD